MVKKQDNEKFVRVLKHCIDKGRFKEPRSITKIAKTEKLGIGTVYKYVKVAKKALTDKS